MPVNTPQPENSPEARDGVGRQECVWGMLVHAAALAGFAFPFHGLPFALAVGGPLVIWGLRHGDSAFVDEQGREALNYQLTVAAVGLVLGGLTWVTAGVGDAWWVAAVSSLFAFAGAVVGAVQAARGEHFRYFLSYKFIRPAAYLD